MIWVGMGVLHAPNGIVIPSLRHALHLQNRTLSSLVILAQDNLSQAASLHNLHPEDICARKWIPWLHILQD
jgi:hypothetical protein